MYRDPSYSQLFEHLILGPVTALIVQTNSVVFQINVGLLGLCHCSNSVWLYRCDKLAQFNWNKRTQQPISIRITQTLRGHVAKITCLQYPDISFKLLYLYFWPNRFSYIFRNTTVDFFLIESTFFFVLRLCVPLIMLQKNETCVN